jgi:tetratricopeptide (TPR) repeat protein
MHKKIPLNLERAYDKLVSLKTDEEIGNYLKILDKKTKLMNKNKRKTFYKTLGDELTEKGDDYFEEKKYSLAKESYLKAVDIYKKAEEKDKVKILGKLGIYAGLVADSEKQKPVINLRKRLEAKGKKK